MSDSLEQKGTIFFNAPKGYTGFHRPFVVFDGGGVEVLKARPVRYCDGVYIFDCPFDEVDPSYSEHFLFKKELNHAANEIKLASGSYGGSVFHKLCEILEHLSEVKPDREKYRWGLRSVLNHENRTQTVGLQLDLIEALLRGEFVDKLPAGYKPFNDAGLRVLEAAIHGPDRSGYLHETFDPQNHLTAMHLGYAALDLLPEEVIAAILEGKSVRNGDILAAIGAEVGSFRTEPIEVDGDFE
jgi:hypothetical protein